MGISKRIAQIPRELVVGKTWIALAHPKAYFSTCDFEAGFNPGIFCFFIPQRIEYIVAGSETEQELDSMEKRGITLVQVTPIITVQTEISTT
jgi:hypothetical protein